LSFLLDTNVVSETRNRAPNPRVLAWLETADQQALHVSVLTIGELAKGIALHRRKDPRAANGLDHWLRGIEELFSDRIIPIDGPIATTWGQLNAERPLPVIDSLLAATAKVRGFTLVTRNDRDVESTGVPVINPWDGLPS
jgi:predicted nucleic acid-binding protein